MDEYGGNGIFREVLSPTPIVLRKCYEQPDADVGYCLRRSCYEGATRRPELTPGMRLLGGAMGYATAGLGSYHSSYALAMRCPGST
eukprot:1967818-Rhodomonas_salina.1